MSLFVIRTSYVTPKVIKNMEDAAKAGKDRALYSNKLKGKRIVRSGHVVTERPSTLFIIYYLIIIKNKI